jgi:hypothetical protein
MPPSLQSFFNPMIGQVVAANLNQLPQYRVAEEEEGDEEEGDEEGGDLHR